MIDPQDRVQRQPEAPMSTLLINDEISQPEDAPARQQEPVAMDYVVNEPPTAAPNVI